MTSLPVAGGEADAFCLLCFSYGIVSPGRSNVNIFLRYFCIFYPAHGTLRAYTVRKRRCSVWLRTIRTRIRIRTRTRTKIRIRAKTRTRSRASRPRNATDVSRADVWKDAGKSRRPFSGERRMPLGTELGIAKPVTDYKKCGTPPAAGCSHPARRIGITSVPAHNKDCLQPERRTEKCGGTREVPPHKGVILLFSALPGPGTPPV